jgi:predicted secreted protein
MKVKHSALIVPALILTIILKIVFAQNPIPTTAVTEEYRSVIVGETFKIEENATSPYEWDFKNYDSDYLERPSEDVTCTQERICTYSFQFTAIKEGNTTIELNKINITDNSTAEIKYIHVIIKSEIPKEEEYKTVDVGDVFTVFGNVTCGTHYKINLKSYDPDYLEFLSQDIVTKPPACYYNFNFKAINPGKTVVELNTVNTLDNKIVGIKYIYVTINPSAIKIVHLDEPFDLKEREKAEVVDYKNMLITLEGIGKERQEPFNEFVMLTIKMPGELVGVNLEEGESREVFGAVIKVLDINFDARTARLLVTLKGARFELNVQTDKYEYSPGETVNIYITLSGDPSIDFNKVSLTVEVAGPVGIVIPLKPEKVGSVSPELTPTTTTGGYTKPVVRAYLFIAKYPLSPDASPGTYNVNVVAKLENAEKRATTSFEVRKVYSDYVDVSIKPKEQHTVIGEPVTYYITITDKHPVSTPVPVVPITPITQNTSSPVTEVNITAKRIQIYTYTISVYGLPYNSIYPTTVNVPAGSSETFRLRIFPSPTETSSAVKEIGSTATIERAVKVPTERVAKSATEVAKPLQSTPAEAVFKFTVQATLSNDPTIRDSDTAILYVKYVETPTPPPFPEPETIEIKLRKGWNLVSVPGKGSFTSGTCSVTQKPISFVYLQDEHRYVSMSEALSIMGKEKLSDYLSTHSFWIYSYEDCSLGFKLESYSTYSGLSISEGWNLLGITKDMVGETIDNIKGSCTFSKIYVWDTDSQSWVQKTGNELIEEMGYGILVKAVSACKLKENIIQPPPFPGG